MIKPLTSLRFFFALMVFVSHLDFFIKGNSSLLKNFYSKYLYEGFIGVSFFFILSGFILSYKYQDKILNKEVNNSQFWLARFARIYPLHLVTLLISLPLVLNEWFVNQIKFIVKFIINLFLLQSFFPQRTVHYAFNSPSWSISTEAFFYLIFPFVIYWISGLNKKLFSLLVLLIFLTILIIKIIPADWQHYIVYVNPFMRSVDFLIGVGLFNVYKFILRKDLKLHYNFIEFFSLILLILFFAFHNWVPEVYRYSVYYWLPMSFIIFSFAFQKGIISKLLSNKLLFTGGEISYGFYMYHQLVLRYFSRIFILENHIISMTFIIFLLTLFLSYISYKYLEKPLNIYLRNRYYN